jgi:hypothetical protein
MKKRYENGGEVNNLSSEKEDEIAKTFANIKGFRGLTPEAVRQGASEGVRSQNEPREIIAERLKDSTLGAMDRLRNVRDRSLTFKEAFRRALDAGEKTFPWQGKMYTTELARSSPSAVKKETPEILPARPMTRRESDAEKARESRLGSSILKRDLFGMEPDAYIVKRRLAARDKEATPFRKGGSVTRGDGIAKRGKTRGRYI